MDVEQFTIPAGMPKLPFVMGDSSQYIRQPLLVLSRTFCGYQAVCWSFASDGLKVLSHTINDVLIGKRYFKLSVDTEVQPVLAKLKAEAIEHGATPEAVWLLSKHVTFSKKELEIMASKLSKAAAPAAKADKPVKAASAKPKGNPEALKKAREAKADAGPDTRKITVVNKDGPGYREGSNRAASWDAVSKAKTVEDYKAAGGKIKYLSRWELDGFVTVK